MSMVVNLLDKKCKHKLSGEKKISPFTRARLHRHSNHHTIHSRRAQRTQISAQNTDVLMVFGRCKFRSRNR